MGIEGGRDSAGEGYGNINRALIESGVIPRLNRILEDKGIKPGYIVFDAMEVTAGFPTPIRTRYLLAVADEFVFNTDDNQFVGISASESYMRGRNVGIGIGLSRHEIEKISKRTTVLHSVVKDVPDIRPDWWVYDTPATDLTAPIEAVIGNNREMLAETFVFGDYDVDKMENIGNFAFETQPKGAESPTRVWEEHGEELDLAMKKISELVEKTTQRTPN